jgi:flavin reductase (DIM6/NTAB) family NADH-FMN oxidoreductase RutF
VPGSHTGAPIVRDALGWIECELSESYDGGDHTIFLGAVLGLGQTEGTRHDALIFHHGRFDRYEPAPL